MKEKSPVVHLCVVASPDPPRGLMEISTGVLVFMDVVIVPLTEQKRSAKLTTSRVIEITFAMHVGVEVELGNIV